MLAEVFNLGMILTTLGFCLITFSLYSMRAYLNESSRAFQSLMLAELFLLVCDAITSASMIFHWNMEITRLFLSFDYVIAYGLSLLFHRYTLKKIEEVADVKFSFFVYYYGAVLLVIIYVLLVVNVYTGLIFSVDANNTITYTKLTLLSNLIYMVITSYDIWAMYQYRRYFGRRRLILFALYPILILLSLPVDMIFDTSLTYVAIGLILLLNILNVALEQDSLLYETQLNTMHLQMRPHFIYNTLASISGLCYLDAPKAAEYINIFSKYLRMSFGDMASKAIISFEEEIKHLDLYLAIEQLRFADLQIERDFAVKNFNLPSLTVQPLVENAIKHGICGREGGGVLKMISYETEQEYIIRIEDNGIGFSGIPDDGRKHIGMENVRSRLALHHMGWLDVQSIPGEGTVATVHINK